MQQALVALPADPVAGGAFARVAWPALVELAARLAQDDPYGEAARLAAALARAGAPPDDVPRVVEHQLWCAWRDIRRQVDLARLAPLDVEIVGARWAEETKGAPVVLCAPMTTPMLDTVPIVAEQLFPGRTVVFFGEGVALRDLGPLPAGAVLAEDDTDPVRCIRSVLAEGGVFATYADFVYAGRSATSAPFFGAPRPFSTGYLSLLTAPGVHLLPMVGTRVNEDRIVVKFEEPTVLDVPAEVPAARPSPEVLAELAALVACTLEGLIRGDPSQWLLLPTLTFDAPQLASPLPS